MSFTFGKNVSVALAGESHGKAVTSVISGISPGISVDTNFIEKCLQRRRGDTSVSTARHEPDRFEIISGVYNGKTTGAPVTIVIANEDIKSKDYEALKDIARPGHADYAAYEKYMGYNMQEGGGMLSGRITAGLVSVGAIALSALKSKGILIGCHIKSCGGINDRDFADTVSDFKKISDSAFAVLDDKNAEKMKERIKLAQSENDSVGGIAECMITGIPAGLGDPFFDSVESLISHMMFSVPAVKGIEFGLGFGFSDITGISANDSFFSDDGKILTKTNNNGGINGGITNGMPIVFRTVIKPTPSISQVQETVNFVKKENCNIAVSGRHDPAIIARIPVITECAAAIVICDLLERRFGENYFTPEE